jgi:hypothetical protein
VILALIIAAVIVVIVITVRDTLNQEVEEGKTGAAAYNRSSVLIKIILNYFQLVGIVATFSFNWPGEVDETLSVQN